ncbi:cuticle protein AM1159-like [Scylla paramamosain]|uniref:cuticle protein AM1159-like n=1 Tax=Scylla paramamosain TaxID=85552 RepID=UPI0030834AE7
MMRFAAGAGPVLVLHRLMFLRQTLAPLRMRHMTALKWRLSYRLCVTDRFSLPAWSPPPPPAPQNIIDGGFVDSFEPQPIVILRDERQDSGDGNFNYVFETANGILEERTGTRGVFGQSNMQGTYRFTLPDGTLAEVRYIADENGFRAESPLIPTPHPLPAHAIEQIRIAEEQREQGITFEPQPFEQ